MNETIRRELQVAFSKKAQPVWFRIAKWVISWPDVLRSIPRVTFGSGSSDFWPLDWEFTCSTAGKRMPGPVPGECGTTLKPGGNK